MPSFSVTNSEFETRQIHAGQVPDPTTGSRALPLYQTTAYQFRDTKHAADLFGLAELGNIYTRIMNPTQDAIEQRIASLEGGVAALLVASGSAATTFAVLNVAEAGDHIVSSPSLYGGTYNLFHYTLPKFGIEVTFVENPDDPESWRKAVKPNTKAFFGETIANPKNDVLDIEAVSKIAHEVGVPLIVDNTVATPYLLRPIDFGADVVVHSATKFLSGHGNAVVGAIVDAGKFDYAKYPDRFKNFNQPDPSYHGLVYAKLSEWAQHLERTSLTSSRFVSHCFAILVQQQRLLTLGYLLKALKPLASESNAMSKTQRQSPIGSRSILKSRKLITPLLPHRLGTNWQRNISPKEAAPSSPLKLKAEWKRVRSSLRRSISSLMSQISAMFAPLQSTRHQLRILN